MQAIARMPYTTIEWPRRGVDRVRVCAGLGRNIEYTDNTMCVVVSHRCTFKNISTIAEDRIDDATPIGYLTTGLLLIAVMPPV